MIKHLTNFLIRKFIKDYSDIQNPFVRSRYGILEGWISIIVNLIIGVVKLFFALLYNSISLIADAIHTISDVATSVIVIIGFNIGQKPSDEEHPFGHGRMEQIATLIIAVLLGVGGIELINYSIQRLTDPQVINMDWFPILIITVTIIFKELLGQISKYLGIKINSLALEADAWHHRTDAISSLLVVTALIASKYGVLYLDGIVGIMIGSYIIYIGWEIAKKSVDQLLGESPGEILLNDIKKIALKDSRVKNVHDVLIHQYGAQKILSMHIEIPDNPTLAAAHTIAEKIEGDLKSKLNIYGTIHLDPVLPPSKKNKQIEKIISDYIVEDGRLESFHDVRLIGEEDYSNLLFSTKVNRNLSEQEEIEVTKNLQNKFQIILPEVKNVQIHFESKYKYLSE